MNQMNLPFCTVLRELFFSSLPGPIYCKKGKKQFKSNNLNQSDADEHQQEQLLPYYKLFLDSNHKRNIDYNM